MKTNKAELLNRLLCISPGVSNKESIQQSSCIVIRKGRLYSLSQEIACALPSGLLPEWEGAIKADKLISLLKHMPEEEIDVEIKDAILSIKGVGRAARLAMEDQVVLPIGEVELPKEWLPLDENFAEAVDLVHRCADKKAEAFARRCCHITKEFIESTDNVKMIRYMVPGFVQRPVLVRGESIKAVHDLGFTKGAETVNWLHFRNPMGLRMSVRKFDLESYPDLSPFLAMRGTKVFFPKSLSEAAETAGIFNETVKVQVTKEELLVLGKGPGGEYEQRCKVKYEGPDMTFSMPHKLIMEMVKDHSQAEITEYTLRVNGGRYIFVTALEIG